MIQLHNTDGSLRVKLCNNPLSKYLCIALFPFFFVFYNLGLLEQATVGMSRLVLLNEMNYIFVLPCQRVGISSAPYIMYAVQRNGRQTPLMAALS